MSRERLPVLLSENRLISSLRVLSNADVMQVQDVRGVLYVEDYTDIDILRAWAARLGHRAESLLTTEVMWKTGGFPDAGKGRGQPRYPRAREHFEALRLVRQDLPGLELRDGDARPEIQDTGESRAPVCSGCAGGATRSKAIWFIPRHWPATSCPRLELSPPIRMSRTCAPTCVWSFRRACSTIRWVTMRS